MSVECAVRTEMLQKCNSNSSYTLLCLDVSPTGQGVDHRQVQRELGEVAVELQQPVLLTASSIRLTWTVSTDQILSLNPQCIISETYE